MRRWRFYSIELALMLMLGVAVGYFGYLGYGLVRPTEEPFSGERAEFYVSQQLEFGERVAGSAGGLTTSDWLIAELTKQRRDRAGWDVLVQSIPISDTVTAKNIVAQKGAGPDAGPVIILSTHYDTRAFADLDPDKLKRTEATPGANAGASGTAILLELARTLNVQGTGHTVCLVFFDAEDNGGLAGWQYAMGSDVFLQRLAEDVPRCSSPRVAVYLDMVGGTKANIAAIAPNAQPLVDSLRSTAESIGYEQAFHGPHKRDEADALARYQAAGIPAIMLSDMGYQQRHTTSDTMPRISSDTLQKVGDVLKAWMETGAPF